MKPNRGKPVTTSETTICEVFEAAFARFLERETHEVLEGVNERANCGRLAIYLHEAAKEHGVPAAYVVDVEYNRKQQGQIKTIMNGTGKVIRVNCDVILHSRGAMLKQDNLIAIEMKKVDRPEGEKQSDRERLQALTKTSFDNLWNGDGLTPPEHVCGYALGVFIELNRFTHKCKIEYYKEGALDEQATKQCDLGVVA